MLPLCLPDHRLWSPDESAASQSGGSHASQPGAEMLRRLRRHHEGVLSLPDQDVVERVRFVLDPGSGQPVLPVSQFVLRSSSLMLYLPDDGLDNPECLQVHAAPLEIDPAREDGCDRHGAYFGKPAHPHWTRLEVASIKRLDEVVDGELVRLANPLRREEGRLCRSVNQSPARLQELARACVRQTGTKPEQPLLVGVDPWGMDVRARFGIIRLEFAEPVGTGEEASRAMERLLVA